MSNSEAQEMLEQTASTNTSQASLADAGEWGAQMLGAAMERARSPTAILQALRAPEAADVQIAAREAQQLDIEARKRIQAKKSRSGRETSDSISKQHNPRLNQLQQGQENPQSIEALSSHPVSMDAVERQQQQGQQQHEQQQQQQASNDGGAHPTTHVSGPQHTSSLFRGAARVLHALSEGGSSAACEFDERILHPLSTSHINEGEQGQRQQQLQQQQQQQQQREAAPSLAASLIPWGSVQLPPTPTNTPAASPEPELSPFAPNSTADGLNSSPAHSNKTAPTRGIGKPIKPLARAPAPPAASHRPAGGQALPANLPEARAELEQVAAQQQVEAAERKAQEVAAHPSFHQQCVGIANELTRWGERLGGAAGQVARVLHLGGTHQGSPPKPLQRVQPVSRGALEAVAHAKESVGGKVVEPMREGMQAELHVLGQGFRQDAHLAEEGIARATDVCGDVHPTGDVGLEEVAELQQTKREEQQQEKERQQQEQHNVAQQQQEEQEKQQHKTERQLQDQEQQQGRELQEQHEKGELERQEQHQQQVPEEQQVGQQQQHAINPLSGLVESLQQAVASAQGNSNGQDKWPMQALGTIKHALQHPQHVVQAAMARVVGLAELPKGTPEVVDSAREQGGLHNSSKSKGSDHESWANVPVRLNEHGGILGLFAALQREVNAAEGKRGWVCLL